MCDAPLPHSRGRRPRRPVALLLANYAVGWPAPPGRRIAGLDIIRLCVGNHPSVTCGDSSPSGEPIMRAGLAANHIMSSTTKPRNGQDRSLQCVLWCAATHKQPVGRDALIPPGRKLASGEQTLQKPVGRGHRPRRNFVYGTCIKLRPRQVPHKAKYAKHYQQ